MALRTRKNALNPTPALFHAPLRAGLLGVLAGLASGCVWSIHDNWWDAQEQCYDEFGDCMDDIHGPDDAAACEATLDACLEACDGGKDDDDGRGDDGRGDDGSSGGDSSGDDDNSSGDGDGDEKPPRDETGDGDTAGDGDGDTAGDGDGDTAGDGDGDTAGDGDGDQPDQACFDIHATCVAEAQTLQDIEACEALFDNCIDPGPCESEECEPGCPQAQLDGCVGDYADCAAAATTAEQVLACEAEFDGCIGEFDVGLCLPNYDDDLVLECLAQHDLCVACADDADQLAACKTAFDNCLEAG